MATVGDLALEARSRFGGGIEEAIFGTADPAEVAQQIELFIGTTLGQIADAFFYTPGVGVVVGLRLEDNRLVVFKAHRWNVTLQRLAAVHELQVHLAGLGLPVPTPLVPPTPLLEGIAIVETYLPGDTADGHRPQVRNAMANMLRTFISAAGTMASLPAVGDRSTMRAPGSLYSEPHDIRFDFDATARGAEWIDTLAQGALDRLERGHPLVVGHFDFRVENLGFAGEDVAAIYDWDSVGIAPEPVIVGHAASSFSSDWRVGGATLPSPEEMALFVGEYENARGTPFSASELDLLDAANLYHLTYSARCEHSDYTLFGLEGEGPLARLLRGRGERFFREQSRP